MNAIFRNPLSLFDISGKVAIVAGATGAFGAMAAKVLAGAGAKLAIAGGNAAALGDVASAARELGGRFRRLVLVMTGSNLPNV